MPLLQNLSTEGLLRKFNIGLRLRLLFACIVVLMFLGSGFSIWYLRGLRRGVERVSIVEQRMSAVLQLDNSVLSLMNKLHRSADLRQPDRFEAEAQQLLAAFRSDTSPAIAALRSVTPEIDRQSVIIESLSGLLEALPTRIQALLELARAGDWTAVHARLLNQVDRTDDVISALVAEINRDLIESRQRLHTQALQAETRAAGALVLVGLIGLVVATFLGVVVTWSITRPLGRLAAGAREMATGDFGGHIELTGNDELTQLAEAHNRASRQLKDLYSKLRLSEARFRSLTENASDMILIVSGDGRIIYASPATHQILGVAPERATGQTLREIVAAEDAARAGQILENVGRHDGRTESFELRIRHHDGSHRSIEGLARNLLADPAVAGIVVNARDVSDRHRAEAQLRERDELLRQAQKMEAIGRLAGGLAHDFNNLLTVINGYGELLLETLDSSDHRHAYAKDIRAAGEQAASLTRQLLAFSRKQMLTPAVLNVNDVVRDTERILRRVIGEDIELVCRLDPSIGPVEADRNQLQQALFNLAANARDAMPHGGRLTIETGESEFSGLVSAPNLQGLPDRFVSLTVSDTGEGMDSATEQRIFEPFFTTKSMGRGTGLGLSTVYGIVHQSGGRIAVRSEIGRGTSFVIQLPRTDNPLPLTPASPGTPAAEARETILLVEDQPEVRAFARHALERFGYRVLEAGDAEEALQVCSTSRECIDLLLTDVVMPGMNGVELSKRLLPLRPEMKVIFASGYADNVMLRHGLNDTGAAFIPKPYSAAALHAKVREVLAQN
jgi:PAS domain S-box-containing protein